MNEDDYGAPMDPAEEAAHEAYMRQLERQCDAGLTVGPHWDPYGTSCDLDRGHQGPHEGHHPIVPEWRIRWTGGGYCAGDALPFNVVDVRKEDGTWREV